MKSLKIILAILMLAGLSLPFLSCASKSTAAQGEQTATVQRGDLKVDIVAGGNLSLSNKEDLAIEISGTQQDPVTVREVLVIEGDSVKAGQVLVKLNVTTLENKVKSQERAVKTREQAVKTAESSLNKTTQDNQIKIKTAELDLETATINFNRLNYPFNFATFAFDVPAALGDISMAFNQLETARAGLATSPGSPDYLDALDKVKKAQQNVALAQERLAKGQAVNVYNRNFLTRADFVDGLVGDLAYADYVARGGVPVSPIVADYLAARAARIAMDKAQNSLDQAKTSVQIDLDKANLALENAREDLDDDRETLAEYKDDLKKSEIVAPFDGFITKINVKGGDAVQKGTVAVQVADPAKFEAEIMVGERDIFRVQEGGTATIQVDAVSTIVLPAKVTHISPTGTIQSGVVNYKVKVEVESLPLAVASGQGQSQTASGTSSSTRAGQFAARSSGSGQQSQSSTGSQGVAGSVPQATQLREGLSVTVSIVLAQRTNVLLVPNQAITRSGRDTQVQVLTGKGAEARIIKTGISSLQYTEVTEGLTEGEKVVVPTSTSTTTSSQNQQRPQQMIIPGVPGGIRR
ncbi:MAG: HlyD family efflux transporter periplasmic adaptor subunit [Chloroflexota bacterium]